MSSAKLIVVSAPSGCGKGTILAKAFENRDVYFSISCTTRKPRKGEVDGKSYFFISQEEFDRMIKDNEFLEYAKYNKNSYGTPKIPVFEHLARGTDAILEIETEGAFKVKKAFPDAVLLFILPPHLTDLLRRLQKRGTETNEVILERFRQDKREIKKAYRYDYVIMNDDLDEAVKDFLTVVDSVRNEDGRAYAFSTKNDEIVKMIEGVLINA